jgi:hypothetical protein
MSAERGWIGEPQEPREWVTPSWSERVGGDGGRHFITSDSARRDLATRLAEEEQAREVSGAGSVFLFDLDVESNDRTRPGNR